MCGIAGFANRSSNASRSVLAAMLSRLEHRGPDEQSGFVRDNLAVGNTRLAIIDIEGGKQPMVLIEADLVAVFNGEIFNFVELRKKLEELGKVFRTRSEIEVLLHLYALHGSKMFSQLNGQFAIAIYDFNACKLILARDRMGIRPLFWTNTSKGFAFASEIKALQPWMDGPLSLNYLSLVQTGTTWTMVGNQTAFSDIHQLPPAHYLELSQNEFSTVRYWNWPVHSEGEYLELGSADAYAELVESTIRSAVLSQSTADVPIACYASGGVDSSIIAQCYQQQGSSGEATTYSIQFDDPEYDESKAQQTLANSLKIKNQAIRINYQDIVNVFPEVIWHAECPLFRTAPAPLFLLSKFVKQNGFKVVLTGEGADEIFLGYDLFREIKLLEFWSRQPQSKMRPKLFGLLYGHLPQFREPRYLQMTVEHYRAYLARLSDRYFGMLSRWDSARGLDAIYTPDIRQLAKDLQPASALEVMLPDDYDEMTHVNRAQVVEVYSLMANYLLSSQGDRMSMAHGVEGRYPYLDNKVIDLAGRIPPSLKLRGLQSKYILRRAFAKHLPPELVYRQKIAYQAPDLISFGQSFGKTGYLDYLLSEEYIRKVGIFEYKWVDQLMQKAKTTKLGRIGTRDNMAFTLILSTMLLNSLFVDGTVSLPAANRKHVGI